MIDFAGWSATAGSTAAAVLLAVHVANLIRVYIRHRTRVRIEQERSVRSLARTAGLVHLIGSEPASVRLQERDCDGHRLIELRQQSIRNEEAA